MVEGERTEDLGVPDPLLEHLGGRLDEVPLDPLRGVLRPPHAAGEEDVEEGPELMEERLDLREVHEGGAVPPPRVGGVAHEGGLGELDAARPEDEGDRGRVAVLVLPGMEVEVEPPESPAALEQVVHLDGGMPHPNVGHAEVPDPEEPARDLEEAVPHPPELEVSPHPLRVERLRVHPDELRVVVEVPALEALRPRVVLPLPREGL